MFRRFAYNPSQEQIEGTEQYLNLAVGSDPLINYNNLYGGVRWWNGPDETDRYIIASVRPNGDQPNPLGIPAHVGFWGTNEKTDNDFLYLLSKIKSKLSSPVFNDPIIAKDWLLDNGYWTNYGLEENEIEILYGALYNWYTIEDNRNITPNGWHVMSEIEYLELYENVLFVPILSGARWNDGEFGELGTECWLWTSDEDSEPFSIIGYAYGSTWYEPFGDNKEMGGSIRLVKDDSNDPATVIGNDGKVYDTVKIGDIVITVKNIAETKYRNNDNIPIITDDTDWSNLSTGAMCYYNNDINNAFTN